MKTPFGPIRVVLVTSFVARYDAISDSFLDLLDALQAEDAFVVVGLAGGADIQRRTLRCVGGVAGLLTDPAFCAADVIIYEFGVWYEGFNALLIGNGRGQQIVRFHNITPPDLVSPRTRPLALRSFRQLYNIARADEVWAVSAENAALAAEYGVPPDRIVRIPLSVEPIVKARLASKPRAPLSILFVGRFVPSKGVLDLIEACRRLRATGCTAFEMVLAGNEAYSDPAYLSQVQREAQNSGAGSAIRVLCTIGDSLLRGLLASAHVLAIPSYHEGFGKTVVEGLAAGCVPIGYASGALPCTAAGLGRLVEPGNISSLVIALRQVLDALAAETALLPLDRGPMATREFDTMASDHAASFAPTKIGKQIALRIHELAQVRGLPKIPALDLTGRSDR